MSDVEPEMIDGLYMPTITTATCSMQRTLANKAAIEVLTSNAANTQIDIASIKSNITNLQTDNANLKLNKQIAAIAVWKVSGSTVTLVAGTSQNVSGITRNSAGNYTINLSTTINVDAPFSFDLKGANGAMFSYVTAMTTNSITVQISNLVLLGLTLIGADVGGCLIIYK